MLKRSFRSMTVKVEYELAAPVHAGLKFVEWNRTGFRRKRAYVYTCDAVSGSGTTLCGGTGARSWFPCIDLPGHTTKLEVRFKLPDVDGMTVVCTGLCIEHRRRQGMGRKATKRETFQFDLKRTAAHTVGFALGFLHKVQADGPTSESFPCYCPRDFVPSLRYAASTGLLKNMQGRTPADRNSMLTESNLMGSSEAQSSTSRRHQAQNILNARPIVKFIAAKVEQKYPQQKKLYGKDDAIVAKHAKCLIPKHDNGTRTPGRRKGTPSEAIVHAQVFVHGLEVRENFHSPALALTNVRSFAGVVMIPGEYLPMPGTLPLDNRLQYAVVNGVAAQWFGCWIDVQRWTDAWLQAGMVGYLTYLYLRQPKVKITLPRPEMIDHVWCRINEAICDEELDPRRQQSVRPLSPKESQFFLCQPSTVGSSSFVALKAPYIVHILDTKDSPEHHFKLEWLKRRVGNKDVLAPQRLERPFDPKIHAMMQASGSTLYGQPSSTLTGMMSKDTGTASNATGYNNTTQGTSQSGGSLNMYSGDVSGVGGVSRQGQDTAALSGMGGFTAVASSGGSEGSDFSPEAGALYSAPNVQNEDTVRVAHCSHFLWL